ncbi:MAG TPA: hypothetical protein VFE53_07720 [Mucilaginibacter sp.]|jgi:hypothetical protein|nr:hypothetical protein [Mucilaginibacter sp.]
MTHLKIKLIIFLVAITVAIIWLLSPDKDLESKIKYIRSLNLKITGIVKQVMPLQNEDHGYGVIYFEHFTSNKGNEYECAYKDRYLFCRINENDAIIVTPGITVINPNDSVSYNTNVLSFKVYRKGKLIMENGIALNDEDSFYNVLNINGYLDFSYFHRK